MLQFVRQVQGCSKLPFPGPDVSEVVTTFVTAAAVASAGALFASPVCQKGVGDCALCTCRCSAVGFCCVCVGGFEVGRFRRPGEGSLSPEARVPASPIVLLEYGFHSYSLRLAHPVFEVLVPFAFTRPRPAPALRWKLEHLRQKPSKVRPISCRSSLR